MLNTLSFVRSTDPAMIPHSVVHEPCHKMPNPMQLYGPVQIIHAVLEPVQTL